MSAPMIYCWNDETKKYEHSFNAQLDPLETQLAGHEVYCGLPQNGTYKEVIEEKEGYDRLWNGEDWEYKEKEKEEEPKPYEPTELDKLYQELYDYQYKLSSTDYINDKINDARNLGNEELVNELVEKYHDKFIEREEWRMKVRELEAKIEELKTDE